MKQVRKRTGLLTWGDLQYFKDGSHVSKTARGGQPYKRNVNVATKGAYQESYLHKIMCK